MSAGELRKGFVGPLEFTVYDQDGVPADLTGSSSMTVKIALANDKTLTPSATFINSGSDGKIRATITNSADISEVGKVRLQPVIIKGGITYPADILDDYVHENLL